MVPKEKNDCGMTEGGIYIIWVSISLLRGGDSGHIHNWVLHLAYIKQGVESTLLKQGGSSQIYMVPWKDFRESFHI